MRTIIDLPEGDIKNLDIIAKHMDVSRAELVRRSVSEYLAKKDPEPITNDIFGKFKNTFKGDTLDIEQEWRAEWEGRDASPHWAMHDSGDNAYEHGAPKGPAKSNKDGDK